MSNKPKTVIIKKINEKDLERRTVKKKRKSVIQHVKEFVKAKQRQESKRIAEDLAEHAIPQKPIVKGVRASKTALAKKLGVTKKKLRKIVIKANREAKGG